MKVTVEGVVTSVEEKTRDKETELVRYTEIMLAQKGEKMQIRVRVPGHQAEKYDLYQVESFTGNLIAWKTRDGVDMMVSVGQDE